MLYRLFVTALLIGILAFSAPPPSSAHASPPSRGLQTAFDAAAVEFGVPEPLLLSVSYHVSLWEDHAGHPSTSGGYGPMHLTHPNRPGTLDQAARLVGERPSTLLHSAAQNIRGGAALLARYAVQIAATRPRSLAGWYGAVALYAQAPSLLARLFADAVYKTIDRGVTRTTSSGETITLAPHHVKPLRSTAHGLRPQAQPAPQAECPTDLACRFIPAAYALNSSNPEDYGNYDVAQRIKDKIAIHYIVIHDTEGSYDAAINTFRNPLRYASANYVVRSSDGLITQMVKNANVSWHSGNYYVNMHAIGIEHEGVAIEGATWYSEQLYEMSARLVRYLAERYHVPIDRAHIMGHDEVPGPTPKDQTSQHWDPGPFWDWQHYMELVGGPVTDPAPTDSPIVTINPSFAANQPTVSYCSGSSCHTLVPQSANFVYLRKTPDPAAPLIADSALGSAAGIGTTHANDWGDKAVTGAQYAVVDRNGDWIAIDYGGRKAWLYSPATTPAVLPAGGLIVTPRPGLKSILVYGRAYPEASAYPRSIKKHEPIVTLQYSIPAGQKYVATDLVQADYYWSPTQTQHALVRGRTTYYQIFFNHRFAYVRVSDVTLATVRG